MNNHPQQAPGDAPAALEILPATASAIKFELSTPDVYAENITRLAREAHMAGMNHAARVVFLGAYAREAKVALNLSGGETGFQAWLKSNIPHVSYASISTAMRVAGVTFAKNPKLYEMDSADKVAEVARLVDGRSLAEFAQAQGVIRRGNLDAATGRRTHTPSEKSDADRHDALITAKAANAGKAVDALIAEYEQGNFGVLTDEVLESRYDQLTGFIEKLFAELVKPRREAAKPVAGAKKRRV